MKRCLPQWMCVEVREGAAGFFEDWEVLSETLSGCAARQESRTGGDDWLPIFFSFFNVLCKQTQKKKRHPSADPIPDAVDQPARRHLQRS